MYASMRATTRWLPGVGKNWYILYVAFKKFNILKVLHFFLKKGDNIFRIV